MSFIASVLSAIVDVVVFIVEAVVQVVEDGCTTDYGTSWYGIVGVLKLLNITKFIIFLLFDMM